MNEQIKVLAILGSLRRESVNAALLQAATELAPAEMVIEQYDIAPIPRFNPDVEALGLPDVVADFKNRIAQADALLIVTPEYNASIPGVLKDALDWASRPPQRVLTGKPVAIMGASSATLGTIRAQLQLRQILQHNDSFVLAKPEVLITRAQEKFDAEGRLIDEPTREQVRSLLRQFAAWTRLTRQEK